MVIIPFLEHNGNILCSTVATMVITGRHSSSIVRNGYFNTAGLAGNTAALIPLRGPYMVISFCSTQYRCIRLGHFFRMQNHRLWLNAKCQKESKLTIYKIYDLFGII